MRPDAEFEMVHYLIQMGLNDCQIARASGIPRGTIRDWRHGKRKGQTDRERQSSTLGDCPKCDHAVLDGQWYAYLLGLYLGDGCISEHRRKVFKLRISLDQKYPGIIEECARAMKAVRPTTKMSVGRVTCIGCIEVNSHWKHWPCLFPQHGPGPKHLREIKLEPWQQEIVLAHPERLLRGLIHSDGTRSMNRIFRTWGNGRSKWYEYPRYQFTNFSADIRRIFCDACDAYGVSWRQMNARTISVARGPDVAKLDLVIGPKS